MHFNSLTKVEQRKSPLGENALQSVSHSVVARQSYVLDSISHSLDLGHLDVLGDDRREVYAVAVFLYHVLVGVPIKNRLHSIIDGRTIGRFALFICCLRIGFTGDGVRESTASG